MCENFMYNRIMSDLYLLQNSRLFNLPWTYTKCLEREFTLHKNLNKTLIRWTKQSTLYTLEEKKCLCEHLVRTSILTCIVTKLQSCWLNRLLNQQEMCRHTQLMVWPCCCFRVFCQKIFAVLYKLKRTSIQSLVFSHTNFMQF